MRTVQLELYRTSELSLFEVNLVIRGGAIQYSTSIERLLGAALAVVDDAVAKLQV